jgi:hypothetical protein
MARRRGRRASSGVAFNAAAAAGAENVAIVPPRSATSIATLLTSHLLQDGEVVLLILKPSLWFILLSALRFIAVVLISMITAALLNRYQYLPGQNLTYQELGLFVLGGRVMWAVLQWMGRLYILTDLRIIRLSGVFSLEIFDCPLRKVARTRLVRSMRERLTATGTIEIIPADDSLPINSWSTIARPVQVHEQVVAAINRAKQGGCGPLHGMR